MKTYEEYLKIIQKREDYEYEKQHSKYHNGEPCPGFTTDSDSITLACIYGYSKKQKMTFDYSVEIMGLMMQDFLEELKKIK